MIYMIDRVVILNQNQSGTDVYIYKFVCSEAYDTILPRHHYRALYTPFFAQLL